MIFDVLAIIVLLAVGYFIVTVDDKLPIVYKTSRAGYVEVVKVTTWDGEEIKGMDQYNLLNGSRGRYIEKFISPPSDEDPEAGFSASAQVTPISEVVHE